jgi:tRNA threonylcarbamoyladenosine modification (KEOPS) complex  Pcc1 subunit
MASRSTCECRISFQDKHLLKVVTEALRPEARFSTTRSKATVRSKDNFLVLHVEAKDTVALRAAVNAYLRWICAVCDALSVLLGKE